MSNTSYRALFDEEEEDEQALYQALDGSIADVGSASNPAVKLQTRIWKPTDVIQKTTRIKISSITRLLYEALKSQSKEILLSYQVQEVNQQHHHLCQYINRTKNGLESVVQQLEAPIQQESVKLGSNILTSLRRQGVAIGSIQDRRHRVVIELE
jgi:hypothetical protein